MVKAVFEAKDGVITMTPATTRGPVYGCYEFIFAPGSAPRSFDELRIEDRTTEQGWLPERLVQFELAE